MQAPGGDDPQPGGPREGGFRLHKHGVYGALAELIQSNSQPPTRVWGADGNERLDSLRWYTVFGPTCASYDALPALFSLPASVREGDWLERRMRGAHSHTLVPNFNGLGAHDYVLRRRRQVSESTKA